MTGHYKESYGDTIDQLRALNKELLEVLKETDLALRKAWKERILPADVISDKLACKITTAIAKCEGK